MLNDKTRDLIRAVATNDMQKARKISLELCDTEKAAGRNMAFCNYAERWLHETTGLIELPASVRGLIYTEDVQTTFDDELYYVSEREQALLERIRTMEKTCEKLYSVGVKYRNAALLFGPSGSGKTA